MPITVQFPKGVTLDFPDDTPQDVIQNESKKFAYEQGFDTPTAGNIFGAGVDTTQGMLYSVGQGLADSFVQSSEDPDNIETAKKLSDFLSKKRQANIDEANVVAGTFKDPSTILENPLDVAKEQILFNAPQALGFMAATFNPLGEITGPLAASTYFTGSNLQRQRDVNPEGDTDFSKAAITGVGQAYLEKLVGDSLLPGIGKLAGIGEKTAAGVSREAVEAATKQSLTKQFGKKFAQAAGLGVSTEVAQQAMERYQAGLDLNDQDAFDEYVDSAIGGAIFAGTGAPFAVLGERLADRAALKRMDAKEGEFGANQATFGDVHDQLKTIADDMPDDLELNIVSDEEPVAANVKNIIKNVPGIVEESEKTLRDSGFDPSKMDSPEQTVKAASAVLKNINDVHADDLRVEDLASLGFDKQTILDYKAQNPQDFRGLTNAEVMMRLDPELTIDDAKQRIKDWYTEDRLNQDAAMSVIQGTDQQSIQNELGFSELKDLLSKVIEDLQPEEVPKDPSSKGKNTLTLPKKKQIKVDTAKVQNRIVKNLLKDGMQAFPDPTDVHRMDDMVMQGVAPGDAIVTRLYEHGLNDTLEDFARNEKTALETKKFKDYENNMLPETALNILDTGQTPKTPIDFYQTVDPNGVGVLDKIQPIADAMGFTDQTAKFINDIVKSANKQMTSMGRGLKDFRNLATDLISDPVTKVKTGIFLNTAVKFDTLDKVSDAELVEAFHYANENGNILSSRDRQFIKRTKKDIVKHFANTVDVPTESFEYFQTPSGMKELLGNIFKEYARNKVSGLKGYDMQLKAIMKKVNDFMEENNKALKKNKIADIQQLLPGFNAQDTQGLFAIRDARFNQVAQEAAAKLRDQDLGDTAKNSYEDFAKQERQLLEGKGKSPFNNAKNIAMNGFINLAGTVVRESRKNPVFAKLNSLLDARNLLGSKVQFDLDDAGGTVVRNLSVQEPVKAGKAFELLLESTARPVLNDDGSVTFTIRNIGKPDSKVITKDPVVRKFTEAAIGVSDETLKQFQQAFVMQPLKTLGFTGNVSRKLLKDTKEILEGQRNVLLSSKKGDEVTKAKIDKLNQRAEMLHHVINWMDRIDAYKKSIYVPRKRSGEYGLTVVDKNGKKHGFYTFDKGTALDNNRGYSKAGLKDAISRIQSDYKGQEKEFSVIGGDDFSSGGRYKYAIGKLDENKIKPNLLTHNALARELNRRSAAATIEDLADLAQFEGKEEVREALNSILETKKAVNGNYEFMLPSEKYRGSSLDIADVYQRHISSSSSYIANQEYKPKIDQLGNALTRNQYFNPAVNPYASGHKNLFDYAVSPEEATGWLRAANFLMALGLNPSTAVLQLVNLVTMTPNYMNSWNKDSVKTAVIWGQTMKNLRGALSDAANKGIFDDPVKYRKFLDESKYLDEDVKDLMRKIPNSRYFGGQLTHDVLNQLVAKEKANKLTSPFLRAGAKGARAATSMAGYMMSLTESSGRLLTMQAFMKTLEDPQALQTALKQLENEPAFKEQVQQYKRFGLNMKQNVALYFLDEAFGVQGKTGRAVSNRSWLGNALFPFVGFQTQQLSSIMKSFSRSPRAGIAILTAYYLLGGLAGLPGFQNANEISKLLFELFGDSSSDLEFEIRELMKSHDVSPEMNEALSKGLIRSAAGVDIGNRIGLGVPFANELLNLFKKDKAPIESTIPGSYIMGVARQLGKAATGQEFDGKELIPFAAIKNAVKGWESTQETITTQKGKPLLEPQGVGYAIKQALGFTPVELVRMRESTYYNGMNDRSPALLTLRTKLVENLKEMEGLEGPEKEKYRQRLLSNLKDIAAIKKEHEEKFNYKQEITNAQRKMSGKSAKKPDRKSSENTKYYGTLEE